MGQSIKGAQAGKKVAEEIETNRCRRAGRVEVDDAATNGKFASRAHGVGSDIAIIAEKTLQPVERDVPARPQGQHPAVEQFARRHLRWLLVLKLIR